MNIKLFIALICLPLINIAQPIILDKVIAIVGKNPLLLSEVETTLLQQKEKSTLDKNSRCKTFEDLLFQKLLLSQADRDSIVVADADASTGVGNATAYDAAVTLAA